MYEGRLKNSNIRVEKRKRAIEAVVCFEGDIRQVLNNVVGNAIDAMPGVGGCSFAAVGDGLEKQT
jgi:signal transduction histidine kinase